MLDTAIARMSPVSVTGVDSSWRQVFPPSSVRTKVPNLPAMMPLKGLPKRTARRSALVGGRYVSAQRGAVTPIPPPPPPPPPQLGARSTSRISLPIDLFFTAPLVLDPGQNEQQVRQSVDVLNDDRRHGNLAGQRDDTTLCASADRAGEVEEGCSLRPAAQDKSFQRRELLVIAVHRPFKGFDLLRGNHRFGLELARLVLRIRQLGGDGHEILLDLQEDGTDLRVLDEGTRDPQGRRQLVHVAVGFGAEVILGDAGAVVKPGAPVVAFPGVDPDHAPARLQLLRKNHTRYTPHDGKTLRFSAGIPPGERLLLQEREAAGGCRLGRRNFRGRGPVLGRRLGGRGRRRGHRTRGGFT